MEQFDISNERSKWLDLVRHVARDRVIVDLMDGPELVAKLVPVESQKSLTDLENALRSIPRLEDDASRFADDLLDGCSSLKEPIDPWDS